MACDQSGIADYPTIPLLRNPAVVAPGERVSIIQHPRGRAKEVALHDNKVTAVKDLVVHYRTDTEPGSSGSPVFNVNWDLVALHHAGWDEPGGAATNEGVKPGDISGDDAAIVRLDRSVTDFSARISDHVPIVLRVVYRDDGGVDIGGTPTEPGGVEVEVPAGSRSVRLRFE